MYNIPETTLRQRIYGIPSRRDTIPNSTKITPSEGFTVDPNGDEGWNAVVRRLCEFLKLPGALRYRSVWEAHN